MTRYLASPSKARAGKRKRGLHMFLVLLREVSERSDIGRRALHLFGEREATANRAYC